jgi:hypothetical protein
MTRLSNIQFAIKIFLLGLLGEKGIAYAKKLRRG